MGRERWALVPLMAVVLSASTVSACGRAESARDAGTSVTQTTDLSRIPIDDAVVSAATPSVVKVVGIAEDCQKKLDASGFVIAPHRVMSMAHAVAGTSSVSVEVGGTQYGATVVLYDPELDISILDVPDLEAQPLSFAFGPARSGDEAVMLGYPGGGDFVVTPARVRDLVDLDGPNIYRTATVTRNVIQFEAAVEQGNSGGPILGADGKVLGMVYGRAVDNPNLGFALSVEELAPQFTNSLGAGPVASGECLA